MAPAALVSFPAMDPELPHRAITDALAASPAPYVEMLDARFAAVEDRVVANVPRFVQRPALSKGDTSG